MPSLLSQAEENRRLFTALYREYLPGMLRIAKYILKNDQDAEDAVQNAFLYIAGNLRIVQGRESAAVKAALNTLAKYRALDILRKRRETAEDPELIEELPWEDLPPENELILEEAIASLPPVQRETLLLYAADGFSVSEIAELTGSRKESVRMNLSRARNRLREMLK